MNANGATYDIARAILEAADEERSPIVIQAYDHNIAYRSYEYFVQLVDHLAESVRVPYAIGLDHGSSLAAVAGAVKAGFTGVMLDSSGMSLEANVAETRALLRYLRPIGVSLEAEVGEMARQEELSKGTQKTDPDDVTAFLRQAEVDLLAVSVGTSHGIHDRQDQVDLALIRTIRAVTDAPLVMHGTSGVPLQLIAQAVAAGMRKINFGEAFRVDFIRYFNELSQTLEHQHHAWAVMQAVKDKLKPNMRQIIRALNSSL